MDQVQLHREMGDFLLDNVLACALSNFQTSDTVVEFLNQFYAGTEVVSANPNPRTHTSTSSQVEFLAHDADMLVHFVVHTIFRPGGPSTYWPLFYKRQSNAPDIANMAERASVDRVLLTHLIPSLGAEHSWQSLDTPRLLSTHPGWWISRLGECWQGFADVRQCDKA